MSVGMGNASAGGAGSCGLQARAHALSGSTERRNVPYAARTRASSQSLVTLKWQGEGTGRREWVMRPALSDKDKFHFFISFLACLIYTNLMHVFTLKFTNSVLFLTR